MTDKSVNMGNLYDLNKTLYSKMPKMKTEDFQKDVLNIGMWFSSRTERRYFMLLCRELNDYTVFEFKAPKFDVAKEELRSLILSRGIPVGIDYEHSSDTYDVWVKRGKEVYMYKLFPCDDFIIPIE